MGWIRDSISWAHFVTVLRETIGELRKLLAQHGSEIGQLRHQNQLLLQRLVHQANEIQRLERRIDSIESHLRGPAPISAPSDNRRHLSNPGHSNDALGDKA